MERRLDCARAAEVFADRHFAPKDLRRNYDECRYITVRKLDARIVVIVWSPRGEARRIISMRRANEREQARYARAHGTASIGSVNGLTPRHPRTDRCLPISL
ncbi:MULTISPECIES: BrnT family toxin [unclassified Thiocapsa]|uniref:BrnT family toxin n=1 Tax=unclassified Thiocapsa TaxID=2641286 RepID=UPI0035B069BE